MKKSLITILILTLMVSVLSLSLSACSSKVVTGVTLDKASLSMIEGSDETLVATVVPEKAVNKAVTWSSSNEAVATVDANGKVSALTVGTATITVTTAEGGFTATCAVTVTLDPLDVRVSKTAPTPEIPVYGGADTLVVGYNSFSSKFSPFFSKTAYDTDVKNMTQVSILTTDRVGNIIFNAIEGETHSYMGTDYLYKGISNIEITVGEEETVYTIEIRDDLFFSDGVHLTIDDVIFSMYALSDPTYTGSSTLYASNIKGMNAYRTNNIDKSVEAAAFINEVRAIIASEDDPTADEQAKLDWCIENAQNTSAWMWVYDYPIKSLAFWYSLATTATNYEGTDQAVFDVIAEDEILNGYFEDYASELEKMKAILLAAEEAEQTGAIVENIEGIVKTGAYSMTVTTVGFDATTIYKLAVDVAPLHYYGDVAQFKYTENKFGFPKGDLSLLEAKTTAPMGAGAYKYEQFTDGIVYFERNELYYKGCPKIENIHFRETTDADKVSGVIAGTFDVTDPSISAAIVAQIQGANSNGELSGNVIDTSLVENLGYGYIGLNASRVKVGTDSSSDASKNLRKAYATVFAVYRDVVTDSYYGERASVIQYPISNTSWAAPQPTDDGYVIAYSKDKDGNPIYTAGMTAEQKYAAALNAAKGFLIAAGFTWDNVAGEFTDVPSRTFHIPADGIGDHPAFGMATMTQAALATIGVTMDINDVGGAAFWPLLEGNQCDFWAAAWQATIDPDMYQVYHSSNAIGAGGTDSNSYHITDTDLDEKIMAARESADQAFRKAVYKECLDIVMDWAVEVPTYQRKNAIIFSQARLDVDSLTPDITTFWGWMQDIELIEMK